MRKYKTNLCARQKLNQPGLKWDWVWKTSNICQPKVVPISAPVLDMELRIVDIRIYAAVFKEQTQHN